MYGIETLSTLNNQPQRPARKRTEEETAELKRRLGLPQEVQGLK